MRCDARRRLGLRIVVGLDIGRAGFLLPATRHASPATRVGRVGVVFVVAEEGSTARGGFGLAARTGLRRLGLALLVVEALSHLLGVPLVVELQQPGEDFAAGRLADREPGALLGLVEAVAQVEVGPAVGGGDGPVHLDVEVAELLDVGGGFVGVVEAVVGLGQALLAGGHGLATMAMIKLPNCLNSDRVIRWKWERFQAIGRRVSETVSLVSSHCSLPRPREDGLQNS